MAKRRAYLAWIAVCVIWGTTYLGIRIALESIPPLLMAACRWIVAGSLLIAIVRARGGRLPARRAWPSLAVRGLLLLGLGNGAVAWAEQTIPSGLTAVLVAIAPFWMVGVDALSGNSRAPRVRQVAGLLVGFAGILVLVWPEIRTGVSGRAFLDGLVSTQLACIGWAVGSAYARRRGQPQHDEYTLVAAAFEMLFGGLCLVVAGLATGEWARATLTPRTAAALLYLTVVGSMGGFSAYRYALQHLPVATVSLYAYANTVIAVMLGILVLGEMFSWRMGAGAAVVLAGIVLVRSGGEKSEA